MKYSWNEKKNRSNFKKHGIWFEEACTVFGDPKALELFDAENSDSEERYILLGMSSQPRLMVVVFAS